MPITCAEMHKVLVDSIELRWKPLARGVPYDKVPSCQLCIVSLKHNYESYCKACPLYLEGNECLTGNDIFSKYYYSYGKKKIKAAQNMVNILTQIKDKYFPEGWDK